MTRALPIMQDDNEEKCTWTLPQKMLLQREKKKLTYKRCFHMKINEEERKLEITLFSVSF